MNIVQTKIIKIFGFFLVFLFLISKLSNILSYPDAVGDGYKQMIGFYDEPMGTLDAVYLGSSTTYKYWSAPWAWQHYGLTVYPFASAAQPLMAAKYLIEEARKTQPNSLFIINIYPDGLNIPIAESKIHALCDYMPLSINKIKMIRDMGKVSGYSAFEQMEYLLPIIRYHSRWDRLSKTDFTVPDDMKGAAETSNFLGEQKDYSTEFFISDKRSGLGDIQEKCLYELFEYCSSEQINVLFVISPFSIVDEVDIAKLNSVSDLCQSAGFPVLNMRDCISEIGLDLSHDYYDINHVNIHGAIKTTDYLSQYLIENYEFHDKRGDSEYSDWDDTYEQYTEIVAPYVTSIEWEDINRDRLLAAPNLSKIEVKGTAATIYWERIPEAYGYAVFRKRESGDWELMTITSSDNVSYLDNDITVEEEYIYSVSAYTKVNGQIYWGPHDYKGISTKSS